MSLRIADGPGADPVEPEVDCEPEVRVVIPLERREPEPACSCYTCDGSPVMRERYYLCATCGNKRCPHATDHRLDCSGSNAPGQKGSLYE